LRERHKLEMYENKVLRKIFVLKKDEVGLGHYTARNFMIYTGHLILLG
jgi:hypothetical protein